MEPKSQNLAEESPPTEWERIEEARKVAWERCQAACETGDLNQFSSQLQEYLGQLDDHRVTILARQTMEKGWFEGTQCLLERGADPNQIALMAIIRQSRSVATLQLFADFGMDYKARAEKISEPVLVSVLRHREKLDWLLDRGLDINHGEELVLHSVDGSYQNKTVAVLNAAARIGEIDLFDHLVARGAKVAQSNALHNACRSKNSVAMLTHLINKYNLDVNADDSCGGFNELVKWYDHYPGPPLEYAIESVNLPAVEFLLKHGAIVGSSCVSAIEHCNAPIAKLLLDAGSNPSRSLAHAITKNFLEGAQLCLEYGGDIALAEARYKQRIALNDKNASMSSEMRKLLDEWKDKRRKDSET